MAAWQIREGRKDRKKERKNKRKKKISIPNTVAANWLFEPFTREDV